MSAPNPLRLAFFVLVIIALAGMSMLPTALGETDYEMDDGQARHFAIACAAQPVSLLVTATLRSSECHAITAKHACVPKPSGVSCAMLC